MLKNASFLKKHLKTLGIAAKKGIQQRMKGEYFHMPNDPFAAR